MNMKNLRYNNICLRALTILCLMMASMGARAADYVIYSNGHFFAHGTGTNITAPTTFNAASCVWTSSGSTYLKNGSYGITSDASNPPKIALENGNGVAWSVNGTHFGYKSGRRLYYLSGYNNNAWTTARSGNDAVVTSLPALLYTVSQQGTTLSTPTIDGNDRITSAKTYNYTGYAEGSLPCYVFTGETTYYAVEGGTPDTTPPLSDAVNYSWSLSSNPYATVNPTTGAITVTSLPENNVNITLTVTANYAGQQKQASKTITLSSFEPVGYVIYDGNNHYLGGTNTTAIGTFNPKTCLWTGTSGGKWQTPAGYYLRLYLNTTAVQTNGTQDGTTLTLSGTESGTTGQKIYYDGTWNDYYLRYNNGWTQTNTANNSGTNVVFAVKKRAVDGSQTLPTISGEDTFTGLGSKTYNKTNAEYTSGYNDYIFYNNTHHYFTEDDNTSLGSTAPASEQFDYVWSLSDEAEGHVTVNPSTGAVSYNKLYPDDTELVLTLTATSRTTHTVLTAEKRITFVVPQLDPTGITASNIDYIMVSEKRNIDPTLTCATPDYPKIYTDITYTAKNPAIATVDAAGQVTGVAAGTAVVTITAGLQGGGSITKDISVVVKDNCVAPTITFSNADNTLTMSTTTPNAKIYYTLDGHDPTAASSVYDPAHKPVLSAAETVKAITISNDAAHYINSPITTIAVAKVATPTVTINGEQVVIACTTPGVTLHYTTDGSTPTAASPTTTGTIDGLAIGTNVKVVAVKEGMINSNVATKVVKYNVPQPVLSFDGTEVTMTCTLDGAKIYYTTNGNNPTTSSTLYDPAAKPTFTNPATVKAIAAKDGYENSAATTLEITRTATPGITVSGTSITLECATPGVTYYYTTDGSEPTPASASTTATTLDDTQVPPGATLKVMAVGSNLLPSTIASKEVNFELTAPEIEIDGGNVAITGPAGATIHYTTDGSEPTESSPTYSAPFSATNGMTYKAIAMKTGYTPSDITTEKYMIASGVSGDLVIINDYEDHTWTYYQPAGKLPAGYPTGYLHSPDPRNLMITYRGGSVDGASAVAISGLTGEGQNEMVYYKTMEKTVPGMTGQYPYQVISNPFSKRPRTNNSTGTNGYWGFAGWKVVSGGDYIAEHADDDVLALDEIIHFTNLDTNYTPNCQSAAIVFEATWTAATVYQGTSAPGNTTFPEGGTYETNFWLLNGNRTAVTCNQPCTVTMMSPDGGASANYRGTATISGAITPGTNGVKIEFARMNHTNAVSAVSFDYTYGRGVISTANNTNTGGDLVGVSSDKNSVHTVKIESGKFSSLHNFTADVTNTRTVNQLFILGCDYDRAKNDNTKLSISGDMWLGRSVQLNRAVGSIYCRTIIKSGNFMTGVDPINAAYTGAGGSQTYYFSVGNTHNAGHRYLVVEGGHLRGIAGGMDEVNAQTTTERAFDLRVRGTAQIDGVVYGAAEYAGARGTRTMIFTGGTINGWVAAGANGTRSDGGLLNGASYVYMGGNTRVATVTGNHTRVLNRAVGGNVFGAGCGYSATSTSGEVRLGTNVVVADNSFVERGVYGGGSYGFCGGDLTTNIFITGGHVGGTVGGVNGTTYSANITGGVFGGACQNKGGGANIIMTDGLIEGGLYGGSNANGTMSRSVTMQIDGGQVGTDSKIANIHGGGYGNGTIVSRNVDITLGKTGAARDADGVTVWGDVYGGSALGKVNGEAATNTYHTNVTMNAGYIHGSLYGGALGSNTVAANVYGPVQVKVYGGSVSNTDGTGANGSGAVYGANNINGAPQRSVTVDIYGTNSAPAEGKYALFSVYGGGNAADYTYGNGYPTVTVHNCDNSIEYVYGGGNAAAVQSTDVTIYGGDKIGNVFGGGNGQVRAANVTGGTSVKIYGGTIGDVYGGSNTQGTIGGTINVNVNAQAEGGSAACPIDIDNVYGGGNKAASNVGNVTIGCAEHIGAVYGGANQANVTGNITLNIVSGHIDNVFGGNNNSGNISGSITVNVNDNGSPCGMEVGNVYGGGNLAKYGTGQNFPIVNIINGALTGSVFGGGKGETAVVTGNPQVNISDWNDAHEVTIGGNVFGGGDAAEVVGTPVVIIKDCDTEIDGNIYGGGNAAAVSGTNLTIWGGCAEQVFGGGNGLVSPADVDGNASAKIYGGTFTEVYGGSNSQGDISGTISVEVNEHKSTETGATLCKVNINDLYGGGNMADSQAGNISIGKCEHIGRVFGGANKANIEGDINLSITDGHIDNVFGGNNNSGQVSGNINVNVNWANGVNAENAKVGNVYGGGNIASIDNGLPRTVTVNIPNATVSGSVFGGGKGKEAVIVGETNVNLGSWSKTTNAIVNGDVFGGGDLAAVEGPCAITIRDCGTQILGDLYGGGNAAPVFSTNTIMWGGLVAGNVFGGGNGADPTKNTYGAQVGFKRDDSTAGGTGIATTKILGGIVGTWTDGVCSSTTGGVFGGSNTNGNIRKSIDLTIDQQTCSETGATQCSLKLRELYGAGNEAAYAGGNIIFNLGCVDYLQEVYGGAKAADLTADVVLNITSGRFQKVFGGNNISGALNGSIIVNIDETGCNPVVIGELYGGGNLAPYSIYGYNADGAPVESGAPLYADPQVNIVSCTSIGTVYGGGYGASAVMVGNPTVNINQIKGLHAGTTPAGGQPIPDALGTIGNVFGGGNAAKVIGQTYVNIGTSAQNAHLSGPDTTLTAAGANITGNVYGGGNQADVTGKTNVTVGQ